MANYLRYRRNRVGVMLADDEYAQLHRICRELQIPARVVLMIGVRYAKRVLAEERRRQPK
jgi:hypothetical protein